MAPGPNFSGPSRTYVNGRPAVFKTVCGFEKSKAMEARAASKSGITRARSFRIHFLRDDAMLATRDPSRQLPSRSDRWR